LYERIVERFLVDVDDEEAANDQRAYSRAIVAHLRTLKRRKRLRPATVIPFRPEDRPT
jgi:hypothetical protein